MIALAVLHWRQVGAAALASALLWWTPASAQPAGSEVVVFPPGRSPQGCIWAPDAGYLRPATTTSCLQEAVTYASGHGYDLQVMGGTEPGLGGAVIYRLDSPLVMPAMQGKRIGIGAATFQFTISEGACWTWDSMVMVDVEFAGEAVCSSTGPAVLFMPVNPVSVDKIVAITASRIRILTIGCVGIACVAFDLSNSGINANAFIFGELNGAGGEGSGGQPAKALFGIVVQNPQPLTAFEQNLIDVTEIHLVTLAGIQVGTDFGNQANLRGNVWRFGSIKPAGANAQGFNSFGSYDKVSGGMITAEQGPVRYGYYFEPGSSGNRIIGSGELVPVPLQDYGRDNRLF